MALTAIEHHSDASTAVCRFIDMDSHQGYTALHIAASHGHLETTLVLLKYGANLTYECQGLSRRPSSQLHMLMNRPHVTALHIAAARRNVPMCRAMLQAHVSRTTCLLCRPAERFVARGAEDVPRNKLERHRSWTLQCHVGALKFIPRRDIYL